MVAPMDYFLFCLGLVPVWLSVVANADYDAGELYHIFEKFTTHYRRSYVTNATENERRFKIFKENIEQANLLNKDYFNISQPVHGITKFSDLSHEEFKALYLSSYKLKPLLRKYDGYPKPVLLTANNLGVPPKVDWRSKGVLTSVKNQKTCGACWAFSVVETMEAMHAIQYNASTQDLSVQELIDCDPSSDGCEGGDICKAATWAMNNGVVQERHYPLTDRTDKCKTMSESFPRINVKTRDCQSYIGEEKKMLSALVNGPVAVAVDATSWHSYVKGIIRFHCSSTINHAVSVVGYDLTGQVPYYIVRNSWGSDFGDNGFIYIKVGDNLCGIASEVSLMTVTEELSKSVKDCV